MTLLIVWLIIGGLEMNGFLYFVSFIVWVFHLMTNQILRNMHDKTPEADQIISGLMRHGSACCYNCTSYRDNRTCRVYNLKNDPGFTLPSDHYCKEWKRKRMKPANDWEKSV